MSVLIEDKTVSGGRSFVASYFAFLYYRRLGFVSILAILLLGTREYLLPGDITFSFVYLFCTCLL